MAKRREDNFLKQPIIDPETGFSYYAMRHSNDYYDDKGDYILNAVTSPYILDTLKELKKDKDENSYVEYARDTAKEASQFDVAFFSRHTKRVQNAFKKIRKKEDHIIKILKSSTLKTATPDIQKIKALRVGIASLIHVMSYNYNGKYDFKEKK